MASVMRKRTEALVITGVAAAQAALVSAGLPGWPCPFRYLLGIPCPGCGLTRAVAALLRGEWHASLSLHAFAPLFLIALTLIALAATLPERPRRSLVYTIENIEQRTGITALLLACLMLYWLIRVLLFPEAAARLIGR
ncbi:MAG: DUF2752 domain-containing protein [Acidobacteria bacterium]|nr:DUF2752 domain-containing protein [Acidobacteriota bacterium]